MALQSYCLTDLQLTFQVVMVATETVGSAVLYVTPHEIYAASIVLPILGVVFVLLGFYSKILQRNSIGIDDWLMLPALICGRYSSP